LFLLCALSEATGAFYFVATEATAADSLHEFGAALAAFLAHLAGQGQCLMTAGTSAAAGKGSAA
jgi:hypothetical protein